MAKFFVSAPAQYLQTLIKEASEINKQIGYPVADPNKEGLKLERDVFHLLQLLEVEEVFFPPSKTVKETCYLSYLDTCLKVDVCVKVKNYYLCWQIKAGMDEAKKHLALQKVTFKDKSYPVPGLIVISTWEKAKVGWKVQVLSEISQVSGIPVRTDVVETINKWKNLKTALKKKKEEKKPIALPSSVFSPEEGVVLTTLGLIQIQGKEVKFM